jgi:hypothetical protein
MMELENFFESNNQNLGAFLGVLVGVIALLSLFS